MNIKEVAREAEVSVTTVSRVLNHPDSVSDETREHVLKVMEKMNYTPNWFARNIQSKKTNMIGLIVPDILDPANMEIAKGVEDVAHQKNCNILMCNTEYERTKELEYVDALLERKVDGIILISTLLSTKDLKKIKDSSTGYVLVGKSKDGGSYNLVYTDYEAAVKDAVEHFLSLGRRKVGMLLGDNPRPEMEEKLKGYRKALTDNGTAYDEDYVAQGENSIEGGYLASGALLNKGIELDAIFASTDLMAFGALENLKQKGISVPNEIALIGFGDLKLCNVVEPKLTSITKPMYRMGLMAARLLFDNIEDGVANDTVEQVVLQSKLKIRKSCGNKERLKEIW